MSGCSRHNRPRWLLAAITFCLLPFSGCGAVLTTAAVSSPQSILKSVKNGPDVVTLEIFQVRVPADDKRFENELWQGTDEQRLGLEVRNRLVSNGFRCGVIAGAMPDALARSLNLQSKLVEGSPERVITDQSATPKVTRRMLQIKRNDAAAIQASELQESVDVLINSDRGLQGKSYREAQGVYSLRAEAVAGQKVKLQLTPELQFGELKNRYTGSDQGIFVVTPSRERKVFDEMKMSLDLAPGEMFLVTGVPDSAGSLGNAFHAERRGELAKQKLVLIRVVQIPDSEILADVTLAAD